MTLLIFLFSYCLVYGQSSLNDYVTVKLIDSLKNANGYGILGYKSLHLKANGSTVYLAAKRIWVQNSVDTATILLGERVNGNWEFNDIHTTNERVYESNVRLTLDDLYNPIIFYKDRTFENGWPKYGVVNVLHNQNSNWENYTAITFTDDATKGEKFEAFGYGKTPGFVMLESYWNDDLQRMYSVYSIYDYQTRTSYTVKSYNLDTLTQYYNSFTWPAVTEDGEYFAHSCIIPTSTENFFNVGLFVYKKIDANQWALDFQYISDTLFSGSPYLYTFSIAIGKALNGDIFLLAKNSEERPFFKKTGNSWIKVEDNYPLENGVNNPGASSRDLNNEKILFASDGTAFWGDIDGCPTYAFSAETSFRTPDGQWRLISCPPAPGYESNGGQYCQHDFAITGNDSLIIVYEFAPYDPNNTVYLLEATVYIPEILNDLTNILNPSKEFSPKSFTLVQNYPNPFNPSTTIRFSLPEEGAVRLAVYDLAGRLVKILINENREKGWHAVKWNGVNATGKEAASGVYIYQLRYNNRLLSRKMLLLR